MEILFVLTYVLIGFSWAKWDIHFKKDLVGDDAGVHYFMLTLFWPMLLFFCFIAFLISILKKLGVKL